MRTGRPSELWIRSGVESERIGSWVGWCGRKNICERGRKKDASSEGQLSPPLSSYPFQESAILSTHTHTPFQPPNPQS